MILEDLQEHIKIKPACLVYFSGENCGVCKALQPKIKEAVTVNFPKIEQYYLDASQHQDIAIKFSIFSVPTVLVFLDGKEVMRKGRNISISQFIQELKRPYSLFFED